MATVAKRKGEGAKAKTVESSASVALKGSVSVDDQVSDGLSMSEFEGEFSKRPRVVSPVEVLHKKVSKSSAMDTMDESCCEGKIKKKVLKSKKKKSEVKVSVEDESGEKVEKVEEVVEIRVPKASRRLNARMREITSGLVDYLKNEGVAPEIILGARAITDRFEGLIVETMLASEHLKGQVEALEKVSGGNRVLRPPVDPVLSVGKKVSVPSASISSADSRVSVATKVAAAAGVSAATEVSAATRVVVPPAIPRAIETWSVVVRGGKGVSAKDVIKKVRGEVGPSLGVRVHDIFALKDGGAVIRIPSMAEREKVVANARFGEVGLNVTVNDKLGPRVVLRDLPAEISVDDFMSDLYSLNFASLMSLEEFKKTVRLVTSPWQVKDGGFVTVILEGSTRAMQHLLAVDRCYIKWFALRVRTYNQIPVCFRCLGFDHMSKQCGAQEDICRHCGQAGHTARGCTAGLRCRNCALRGHPADHFMLSEDCPIYRARLDRLNSRH